MCYSLNLMQFLELDISDLNFPYCTSNEVKFCLCLPFLLKQPQIILLKEGTDTSQGVPQIISNINACQAIADAVRTTLGPRGMDKLIVNDQGKHKVMKHHTVFDQKYKLPFYMFCTVFGLFVHVLIIGYSKY